MCLCILPLFGSVKGLFEDYDVDTLFVPPEFILSMKSNN
jgi:hypothetical protein